MSIRSSSFVYIAVAFSWLLDACGVATASTSEQAQARIDADLSAGNPIVVHVVVALCDNENQGIVPVPAELGNGQNHRSNLYWGALYGVKTHFVRHGWNKIDVERPKDERILDRVLFSREIRRGDTLVPVYVLADAWDGAEIRSALTRFLSMSAGEGAERVPIVTESSSRDIRAGGDAHLVAYVGHNGLMEFNLPSRSPADSSAPSSSIVLACASKPYFRDRLQTVGSHPLLLTTGLMAPEAYTLDAAIQAWIGTGTTDDVVEAAARAYDKYQKCGLGPARGLFWGKP